MLTTSRTRLTAVLASLLVLFGVLVPTSGAQAAPQDRQKTPYSRAQAEKLLAQVQQAMAPKKHAPRALGDPLPRRDLSLLLRRLQVAKAALSATDQSIVDDFNRPVPASAGCKDQPDRGNLFLTWKVRSQGHFCVHYLESGARASTSAQVNLTLAVMNSVYAKEIGSLHYRAPLNDGDHLYDVFLDEIGDQGYYGFCTTDTESRTSTAWCGLDNDFATKEFGALPGNSLRVTAAHEFFHAIQFAYDAGDSTWFLEGTAVWMEDQVYPAINDYLQYLRYSQITQSEVPIDTTGTFERYGAVIFWKYLSEGYHSVDIIRQIWISAAVSHGSRNAVQATASVLNHDHHSFADSFARFSVWNTLPGGSYADRKLFPHPAPWGTAGLGVSARDTGTKSIHLNHLSSANVKLVPSPALSTSARLTVSVDAPSYSVGRVRVQVRKTNGSTVYQTFTLNSSGNGSHSISFSGRSISSVWVTLANVTVGKNSQGFTFRARITHT